jgi:hypothetical protein
MAVDSFLAAVRTQIVARAAVSIKLSQHIDKQADNRCPLHDSPSA